MGVGKPSFAKALQWMRTKPVRRGKAWLISKVEDSLAKYGEFASAYPRTLIVCSVLVCIVLGLGFCWRETDYDMNTLYSLPNTESLADELLYKDTFRESRFNYVIASSDNNMLTRERLEALRDIDEVIDDLSLVPSEITVDETGSKIDWSQFRAHPLLVNDQPLKFTDLCVRDAWGDCDRYSVYQLYLSKTLIGGPIVLRNWPFISNLMKGKHFRADAILGGMTVTTKMQGAKELRIIEPAQAVGWRFDLRNDGIYRHLSAGWEEKLTDALQEVDAADYDIAVKTHRSLTDELRRMSTVAFADALRIFAALGLLLLYTVFSLMSCNHRSKLLVGICGTGAALMGYAAGSGLCYWLGLHHVPPCEATPFLVMGIGVDDMFVLINSYSLTYPLRDHKQRLTLMIRDAGLSITLTTITNIVAFAVGMASPYYSIAVFCITTSVSLLFGYILCLTFFLPVLALDASREAKISTALAVGSPRSSAVVTPDALAMACAGEGGEKGLSRAPGQAFLANPKALSLDDIDTQKGQGADAQKGGIFQVGEFRSEQLCLEDSSSRRLEWARRKRGGGGLCLTPGPEGPASRAGMKTWRSAPSHVSAEVGVVDGGELFEEDDGEVSPGATPDFIQHVLSYLREGYQTSEKPARPWWPEPAGNPGRRGRQIVCRWYAPLTGKLWWKLVVLVMIAAYVGSSIWGLVHLEPGLGFREITPDDSYLRHFYDASEAYFSEYGQEVIVYDVHSGRDWSQKQLQENLADMTHELEQAKGAQLVVNGLDMFVQSHPGLSKDDFVPTLEDWIENDPMGMNHKGDMIIEDGVLARWRFHYWMPYLDNSQQLYDALQEGKVIIHSHFPEFHAYTPLASMWESDPRIIEDTATNLAIALVAIVSVCCILLPSWRAAAIVVVTIVMIDIGIMGYMHFWGLKLNLLTMVSLLISVGYAVDYTVHFVHCYGHKRSKDTQKRLTEMLTHITVPVTHGAVSSFVAITMLSGSDKHVVYVFFQMLTLVLAFAWLNGTVFIPIYFAVFLPYKGPKPEALPSAPSSEVVAIP